MKRRNGFVSNSSSSSFLLFLDRIPESVEEVKCLLFNPTQSEYINPYVWDNTIERDWPIKTVSEIVLSDIEKFMAYTEIEKSEYVHDDLRDIASDFSDKVLKKMKTYPNFLDFWNASPKEDLIYFSGSWSRKKKTSEELTPYELAFKDDQSYPQEGASKEELDAYQAAQAVRWEKYNQLVATYVEKIVEKLPKNKQIVRLEYSDNDGTLRAAMEHGNLFKNVLHIKVSHH